MLARWRTCSTLSGEFSRRCCVNKKENVERVANYLRTMGTTWRALSRPNVMIMGQIACLDAYGDDPQERRQRARAGCHTPPRCLLLSCSWALLCFAIPRLLRLGFARTGDDRSTMHPCIARAAWHPRHFAVAVPVWRNGRAVLGHETLRQSSCNGVCGVRTLYCSHSTVSPTRHPVPVRTS